MEIVGRRRGVSSIGGVSLSIVCDWCGDSTAGGASLTIAVGKSTLLCGGEGSGVGGKGDCIETSNPSGETMGNTIGCGFGADGGGTAANPLANFSSGGPRAEKDWGT